MYLSDINQDAGAQAKLISTSNPEESILGILANHRVVKFEIYDSMLSISEQCDDYFYARLNAEEFDKLLLELQTLRKEL